MSISSRSAKPFPKQILLLILIALSPFLFFLIKKQFFSKDERLIELEKEVRTLRDRKSELQRDLIASEEREYIEKEARQRLNMAYPGETVVILPQTGDQDNNQEQNLDKNKEVWQQWIAEVF